MLTLSQILVIAIFMGVLVSIILGRLRRYVSALIGAALIFIVVFTIVLKSPGMALGVLNIGQIGHFSFWIPGQERIVSHGVNWQTIIFIAGMMTMVEGLGAVGFFRWLCLYLGKLVNYRVVPILLVFMLLSGFLSMFISSITVLLFLASVTIELARLLKFDPVPIIIAEVFASNVGGAATMAGDPPNIIIGTSLGYHFADFAVNTGLIAWAGMGVALGFFYFCFRKVLTAQQSNPGNSLNQYPAPKEAIVNPRLFKIQAAIFIMVIVLLVTHAQTGLSVAMIGCIGAAATLLATGRGALHIIKGVDWRTLLFLIGLFICVGGLEETGVLGMFAGYIGDISRGNIQLAIPLILWFSAFISAVVDNIPLAAAMVPVITHLSQATSLKLPSLAWALALGTDIGGNATPIGASANVVATAIAKRQGYRIRWGQFLRYALPAMIMVVALCHLMLILRYA
jgi:Na+/H+ antiporter NhaD/arsenite permease-like protein